MAETLSQSVCVCVCDGCSPLSNLTNWDYNIAVCLGLDSLQLLLTVIAFTVLASTLYIIDRYFNSHYVIRRKVRPSVCLSVCLLHALAQDSRTRNAILEVLLVCPYGSCCCWKRPTRQAIKPLPALLAPEAFARWLHYRLCSRRTIMPHYTFYSCYTWGLSSAEQCVGSMSVCLSVCDTSAFT